MANASIELSEEVLGQVLRLRVFKRSGPAMAVVLKELRDDVYRLRHIAPPPPGAPVYAVDLGASVGFVAVLLARLWPGARIVAVEPAPANFRYLLWNVRANGVAHQVWPLNLAVGSQPAKARSFFYSPTYPTWSQSTGDDAEDVDSGAGAAAGAAAAASGGADDSWRGGWTDWQVRFDVGVATLAELVASLDFGDLHFLKVDCEGCEWSVFEPVAWSRLRHRIRHVATELHAWALPGSRPEEEEELQAAVRDAVCAHETVTENMLCSTM